MNSLERYATAFSDILDDEVPKAFWIYTESRNAFLAGNIKLAERLKRLNYLLHNSEIPYTAEIGKNSVFAYGGIGVIVHANARIGERCNFGSAVTIGGSHAGIPIIGDDVYLSTGSKVIGNVRIGDGAVIGANAVVTKDVLPFTVVAGLPAKQIATITPDNFENYSGFYWCKGSDENIRRFLDWYFVQRRARMPG